MWFFFPQLLFLELLSIIVIRCGFEVTHRPNTWVSVNSCVELDTIIRSVFEGTLRPNTWLQGGEVSWDALSRMSFFAKEPLIIGLFCGKLPMKIRHPMGVATLQPYLLQRPHHAVKWARAHTHNPLLSLFLTPTRHTAIQTQTRSVFLSHAQATHMLSLSHYPIVQHPKILKSQLSTAFVEQLE